MLIGDQIAVCVDDHGGCEIGADPEADAGTLGCAISNQALGVDVRDGRGADIHGVGIAEGLPGWLYAEHGQQVGPHEYDQECDRESYYDRLQQKNES